MSLAAPYHPGELEESTAKPTGKAKTIPELIDWIIAPLGSQKIAVAAFAYGIFVIFVGTLAQTEMDIWEVMPKYFRAWIMYVDINLIPSVFNKSWTRWENVPLIPLPGGMFVGITMILNMLFAHLRWVLQLKGKTSTILAGTGLVGLGWLATLLVILSGHNQDGLQTKPPFTWPQFWTACQVTLIAIWVSSLFSYFWVGLQPAFQKVKVTFLRIVMLVLAGLTLVGLSVFVYFMLFVMSTPTPETLRIVWQLLQGTFAGAVLLGGCVLLFMKRGGVVLLHQGLLLLMVNELFVARYAVEYNMMLGEGQTSNVLRDIRSPEIALIDRDKPETDQHFVVPFELIASNAARNGGFVESVVMGAPGIGDQHTADVQKIAGKVGALKPIPDAKGTLPVDVVVLKYVRNADLRKLDKDEKPIATAGIGLEFDIKPLKPATGTDSSGGVDQGAAYVRFQEKGSGKDLGTHLLFVAAAEREGKPVYEEVKVGDKTYHAVLRFKRQFVPFTVQLEDVRKDDYVGTATPKNYSSDIVLKDNQSGIASNIHIKMNDPLRYRGLTFYQNGYNRMPTGEEYTTLSVVRNNGFLIPYVALMIITVGMITHFMQTLIRFLRRRETEEIAKGEVLVAHVADEPVATKPQRKEGKQRDLKPMLPAQGSKQSIAGLLTGAIAASIVFLLIVAPAARLPQSKPGTFDYGAFGRLPVAQDGRVKPLDSVARNALLLTRQRETAVTATGKKISATEWLLDVITESDAATGHRFIKIDDPDIRKTLELEDATGHLFSLDDIMTKFDAFNEQYEAARKLKASEQTAQQRGVMKIAQGLHNYRKIKLALIPFPELSLEQLKSRPEMLERVAGMVQRWRMQTAALKEDHPLQAIPVIAPDPKGKSGEMKVQWGLLPEASLDDMIASIKPGGERNPAVAAFTRILDAYAAGKPDEFNTAVSRYEAIISKANPPEYSPYALEQEAWFNHFSPFYLGMILYVIAFLVAAVGWLIPSRNVSWAAFTLILLTFVMHTAALILRIYISGRPPVTNLYSSAVFIGWFCVLIGLIVELVFRIGIGNLVATLCGFSTLIVAYYLGIDGDTIGVLQAVLDTQFWLATHVVCITLGYGATYFAGFLGLLYVLLGIATPRLDGGSRKILGRMIYGITCFALFFSFFGTVLGGLWADDSWGRFWGWDPKENGALMIVLWNALVLHARWDKMVGDRGLALLAIGGNIITSWSWFGVNGLDVGLHSYGQKFGVMETLAAFVLSQLVIILIGLAPLKYWWSVRKELPPGVA